MRKFAPVVIAFFAFVTPLLAQTWQSHLANELPLLGHRNWILIVDSAYPDQVGPGIETIVTHANELDVLRYVLASVNSSIHVRPVIFLDAELPFVPEKEAPGVTSYRATITRLLKPYPVISLPHDKIISSVEETGKKFRVLVLKTNMAIPYTSVFIRLNAKYWSDDAEKRLRDKMKAAPSPR